MAYTGKYKTPKELISDDSLSRDVKVKLLELWLDDKEAVMRAADEGMRGEFRTDLLSEIQDALTSLEEDSSPS